MDDSPKSFMLVNFESPAATVPATIKYSNALTNHAGGSIVNVGNNPNKEAAIPEKIKENFKIFLKNEGSSDFILIFSDSAFFLNLSLNEIFSFSIELSISVFSKLFYF